ncbi:caspase-like [Drosophila innubila]|uniref:caspase-like n=1 Tax=Drosophila innubila TaxID=198719 RepID=UPI00148C698B|nr:caspase-like [Drosophila innubila]
MAEEKSKKLADEVRGLSLTDGNCFGIPRKCDAKGNREIVARMVTRRDDPEYKMSHKYRGSALIFSHESFDKLEPRSEANVDYENLKKVLDQLDFEVKPYKDLSYEEVRKKIAKAAGKDHTDHDCILVAILTQGESDMVWAKDKCYKVDDIWSAFTPDKCPTLAGKPKIFFVQATQAKLLRDPGFRLQHKGETQTDGDSASNYKIPLYADFLVAFSSIPEYCSWSDSERGSWFIKSLCEELSKSAKSLDLLMLLTFVAQRVAVDFETYDEGHKQITCTMSTLTRILRFADQKRRTSK